MDRNLTEFAGRGEIYPPIEPYRQHMLDVDDGHSIYLEECGSPGGMPIVILHGGPGGGCSSHMRRLFNPGKYRAVLFDQRGCGRSHPAGSVHANTTWDLIADIETIRDHLGIRRWAVFGGSWGATLGLLYAQQHPVRVHTLILRGVFLMTRTELDWFYGGGAARFWPDAWERFQSVIPPAERGDLIKAYHHRLFSGDDDTEVTFGKSWLAWENQLSTNERANLFNGLSGTYARIFSRIETHYLINTGFLNDATAILNNMAQLAAIPGKIIQGRFDLLCPPHTAHTLHRNWPASELLMTKAGHAMTEPATTEALVSVLDNLPTA